MKKKIILTFILTLMLSLMLVVYVNAEVTTYDDAPERTMYQCIDDEIIEFYDGFKCPVSYVLTDTSTIGTGDYNTSFESYMDFTYINGKLGKTEEDGNLYTYADVKGFDIPTGITHVAKYAGRDGTTLKWITFPDTISSLSNAIFQRATGLEECTFKFSENNTMRKFPAYMFFGCENLKAFSMPDCFTSIHDIAQFSGCTNLGAVHLSESLETWSSGGGGSRTATFDDCVNMYFVNETFTYDNIPEKPEVYYFPANLNSITNNSVCRECKNLNNVLVFGTELTTMPNVYFFQNGPANKIVFLGDMTTVATQYWGKTTQIIFANPADTSLDDVTYSGGRTTVFCNAEDNTIHLAEKTVDVEAKCEIDAGKVTYCFCGYEMSKESVEGTALSHDYDYLNSTAEFVSISYTSYLENGTKTVSCARCGENGEVEAPALFICLGYSAKIGGTNITVGYTVNQECLALCNQELRFGVVAYVPNDDADNTPINNDLTLKNPERTIFAEIEADTYVGFNFILNGFSEESYGLELIMSAFVYDGEKVYYLGASGQSEIGETFTFDSKITEE